MDGARHGQAGELLEHAGWLRSLARSLVADAHAADDVVQETLLAALEHPPRPGVPVRRWLAAIARNFVRTEHRAELRRAAREARAARAVADDGPERSREQIELARVLLAEVEALGEPWRSVVVARYLEGEPPHAIAARTGVPLKTVKNRLARALELLRERLDRRHGGDRSAWLVLLAPLSRGLLPSLFLSGSALLSTQAKLVVAAVVLVCGLAVVSKLGGSQVEGSPDPSRTQSPSELSDAGDAREPSLFAAEEARTAVAAPAARPAVGDTARATNPTRITGRFLLPGGEPAAGVAVQVHGWQASQDRLMLHGPPKSWTDPAMTSDAQGRFELSFDPPRAYQFTLDAKLAGFVGANWRWNSIEPGETKDLGEIGLMHGGSIEGVLVDAHGTPLHDDWTVHGESPEGAAPDGRQCVRAFCSVDERGSFRLGDFPAGTVRLIARSTLANGIDGPTVEVRVGETTRTEIRYTGPDLAARILVSVSTAPFHVFAHDVQQITLRGAGIEPLSAERLPSSSQSFVFDGVPPGEYTVEIADPRFLPWIQTGVRPGSSVTPKLVGSASVALDVADASGTVVEEYALRVRLRQTTWRPNEYELRAKGTEGPRSGIYAGLVPGSQSLVVLADGFADQEFAVDDLAPGEMRRVSVVLSRGARIAGRVVDPAGHPTGNLEVVLEPQKELDPRGAGAFVLQDDATSRRKVRTDASGAFELARVGPGVYRLSTHRAGFAEGELRDLSIVGDEPHADLELVLPATATLSGRVIAPPGAELQGMFLFPRPRSRPTALRARLLFERREPQAAIAQDGSYRLEGLPRDEYDFYLEVPATTSTSTWNHGSESSRFALGQLAIDGDQDLEHDFDARAKFPGSVEVEVHVLGGTASGLTVQAIAEDRGSAGSGVSGPDGHARLPAVRPGPARLVVRSSEPGWCFVDPATFVVEPGRSVAKVIDVALIRGKLSLVGKDSSAPLQNTYLLVRPVGAYGWLVAASTKTDEEGVLQLTLPAGRYEVVDSGDRGFVSETDARGVFEWTAAGPSPASVAIGR